MDRLQTAERVSASDASDNFVLARSVLAYREAARRVSGDVLEIGTGSGYGVEIMAPRVSSLVSVDKFELKETGDTASGRGDCAGGISPRAEGAGTAFGRSQNVSFRRMKVPPLDFPSNSFDYVVSFQVIEHIKDDEGLLAEVARVLKPGGQFIVTTPNATASLTRNPWHVREYTAEGLATLLGRYFGRVEAMGVSGDERVMEYYERNRQGVERIARLDPLKLRDRLPRWMLKVPYDIANRLNRRRLLEQNGELTKAIAPEDYRIEPIGAEVEASGRGAGAISPRDDRNGEAERAGAGRARGLSHCERTEGGAGVVFDLFFTATKL